MGYGKGPENLDVVFRRSVEATPNGIVVIDPHQPKNPVVYCNEAYETLTGTSRDEIIGKPCGFLRHRHDLPVVDEILVALNEERECHVQLQIENNDGSSKWTDFTLVPIRDEQGVLRDFFGVLNDIDARVQAEDQLNQFFDLSIDMLCVAGLDGTFKRVNPAFERTLGFTAEELLARPFIDFVHPDDREATLAEVTNLESGGNSVDFQNRYRCKDGSYRWFEWTCPAPSSDSQMLYAVARDVTRQKRAEEAIGDQVRTADRKREVMVHLETLSPREFEVLKLVVDGLSSKLIAERLHRSEKTIEKHRANLMRKMHASSLAELVRDVTAAGAIG